MLLSLLALILFALGFATMVFLGDMDEGLKAMFIAFLISPYGIPMLAAWLIGTMGGINERLKAIWYHVCIITIFQHLDNLL